ncbi:hypothetical protein nACB1_001 [Acinetobacter phage nACB1]|nr:hypothetical protein nACB1_001 [Acinetobacter phage nACB1]
MSQQVQPSIMGSLALLASTAANTATNTIKMIDNVAVAGERITYIAKSKATNIAEISDVQDSMKMLTVRKELKDQMATMGASYKDGVLSFD